jgi:hypothetical protein
MNWFITRSSIAANDAHLKGHAEATRLFHLTADRCQQGQRVHLGAVVPDPLDDEARVDVVQRQTALAQVHLDHRRTRPLKVQKRVRVHATR